MFENELYYMSERFVNSANSLALYYIAKEIRGASGRNPELEPMAAAMKDVQALDDDLVHKFSKWVDEDIDGNGDAAKTMACCSMLAELDPRFKSIAVETKLALAGRLK